MKHRRVFVALICLLSSAVAAPRAAAADDCLWKIFELAWPDKRSEVRGSSPDNRLIVGTVTFPESNGHGVIWTDGILSWMRSIPGEGATSTVTPHGVNNSGVVVGDHRHYLGDEVYQSRAFRYQNGAYENLYTAPGESSTAIGINEAGDIIGEVWKTGYPSIHPWIALWPRDNHPRRLYLNGKAVGITDDRKLVVEQDVWSSNRKVWSIDGNTGTWTALPGSNGRPVLDDNRLFTASSANNSIHEWTLDGRQVGTYEKGWAGHGRNSSGTVYGWTNNGASLWQGGARTRTEVVADQVHYGTMYGDITDDGRLIGTYRDAQQVNHAAIWFCS
ncbi:hypothetical protein LFM09_08115 [Lentzea alba]|uniref:hypothetical protein n=1 Tax=Lentzea alba TaxID=2714351 RepID=UPI0039BF1100